MNTGPGYGEPEETRRGDPSLNWAEEHAPIVPVYLLVEEKNGQPTGKPHAIYSNQDPYPHLLIAEILDSYVREGWILRLEDEYGVRWRFLAEEHAADAYGPEPYRELDDMRGLLVVQMFAEDQGHPASILRVYTYNASNLAHVVLLNDAVPYRDV